MPNFLELLRCRDSSCCNKFQFAVSLQNEAKQFHENWYFKRIYKKVRVAFFTGWAHGLPDVILWNAWVNRDHSGYRLSQWETTLHHNVVSQRLIPYPELSLPSPTKHCQAWIANIFYAGNNCAHLMFTLPISSHLISSHLISSHPIPSHLISSYHTHNGVFMNNIL